MVDAAPQAEAEQREDLADLAGQVAFELGIAESAPEAARVEKGSHPLPTPRSGGRSPPSGWPWPTTPPPAGAPRIRQLSNLTEKNPVEAAYLEMWRARVERFIGTANYPGNGVAGELRMQVVIRDDGALLDARIIEPSGVAAVDAAALRIVSRMGTDWPRPSPSFRWRCAKPTTSSKSPAPGVSPAPALASAIDFHAETAKIMA